jgi:ArsR family transcriptional regulator
MNVTQLSEALGTIPVTVSQQLMRLRAEGIVQSRRDGKRVIYSLARAEVAVIGQFLRFGGRGSFGACLVGQAHP